MKFNINKLWFAIFPLVFVACQNEDILVDDASETAPKNYIHTLHVAMPENLVSRAHILQKTGEGDFDEEFFWDEEDCFAVYPHTGTNPDEPYIFKIADSYSNSTPSSSASFSTLTDGLVVGDEITAFYPVPTVENGSVKMSIDNSGFVSGTPEEWHDYFAKNLFMSTTITLDDAHPALHFEHLTTIFRISYTNYTENEVRIGYVNLEGNQMSFGTGKSVSLQWNGGGGGGGNPLQMVFSDLIVPAGETKDFYFIAFGQNANAANPEASIRICINTGNDMRTSELSMSTIAEVNDGKAYFESGKRYWFNVMQTDEGLVWVKQGGPQITNLPLIAAIEESEGIQFTKTNEGYVNVYENYAALQNIEWLNVGEKGLTDLSGIEYLPKLETLYCNDNPLGKLDISKSKSLKYLSAWNCELTEVIVNEGLLSLDCHSNNLDRVDLSHCLELEQVDLQSNKSLTSIDVTRNRKLEALVLYYNPLTELDVTHNTELISLQIGGCKLTSLNLSNNSKLEGLYCDWNQLTELELGNNPNLVELCCDGNSLTSLDVSGCLNLNKLYCHSNLISKLDISNNGCLSEVYCGNQHDAENSDIVLELTLTDQQRNSGIILNDETNRNIKFVSPE